MPINQGQKFRSLATLTVPGYRLNTFILTLKTGNRKGVKSVILD